MRNGYFLAILPFYLKRLRRVFSIHDGRSAGGIIKLEMNDVVLAFAELQFLVGGRENVMPELAISAGLLYEGVQCGLEADIIHLRSQGCAIVHIIDKAQEVDFCMQGPVRTHVMCPTCGLRAVQIIQSAGNQQPVERGIATALAGSKPWTLQSVFSIFLGYPQFGPEVVLGPCQSPCLHNADVLVQAIFPACKVGKKAGNPVITRGGIIVEVYQRTASHPCNFVFQFPDEHRVHGAAARHGAVTSRIYKIPIAHVMQQLSPLDAQ